MIRAGTFILVLAAHAAIIGLLIGGCPDRHSDGGLHGGPRSSDPAPAASPAERRGGGSGDEVDATPSGGARDGAARFSPRTFAASRHTPPSGLSHRAAQICKAGVVVDWTSRRVLWSHKPDEAHPIASLTKMMTALLVAERVQSDPGWSWDREVPVTEAAWRIGGSQVWLDPREVFTVDELLKATLIFSANDTAYLLAEAMGNGDPAAFVGGMNRRARQMGLSSMHFSNPHGLPEGESSQDNRATALECAYLAGRLLAYPRIAKWASTRLAWLREDTDQPLQLLSRNPLVGAVPGVNGMKTGFTARAGFCIAATCTREGRTLIVVLLGCDTKDGRNELVGDFLDWGYSILP